MSGLKGKSAAEFFEKSAGARRALRSFVESQEGRVVLQELVEIRDNNNDLQAVASQAKDSTQLAKIVAEQSGYVRALDTVLGLFERYSGEDL